MSQTKAQLISDLVQALNFTGTSSAPANGMYLSDTNTIKLATNSNPRLTIDSSGNAKFTGNIFTTVLRRDVQDSSVILSGGNATNDGANIALYGSTHGSQAGNFEFRSGAGYVLKIKSDGKVGIGTTNPDTKLHISSADIGAPQNAGSGLMIEGSSADLQFMSANDSYNHIFFGDPEDPNIGIIAYHHASNSNSMVFTTNTSTALTLDSSQKATFAGNIVNPNGRVLIGTTVLAPYTTRRLTIGDTTMDDTAVEIRSSNDSTGRLYFTDSSVSGEGAYQGAIMFDHGVESTDVNKFNFYIGSNKYFSLDSSVATFAGKIAINTVARIESTGEYKAAHGTAATPSYNFLNDNDNGMYRVTTNTLGFSTGGTHRLSITSDGFVQIGASADAAEAPLHVTSENSQGINAIFGAKDFIVDDQYNYDDANIALQGRDAGGNETGAGVQFTVRNTGNSNWLHGAFVLDRDANYILYRGAGNTDGAERLRMDSSGRIGIQGAPTRAHLEVRSSGGTNTMLTAVFGANEGGTTGALTDDTDKGCRIGIQHYDTDALPFAWISAASGNTANSINMGGGTSLMNAATAVGIYTASNTTTATGIKRFMVESDGTVHKYLDATTIQASFGGSGQVNGITAVPSMAATPFVVGRDTGSTRSAHFGGHLKFDSGYGIDFGAVDPSGTSVDSNILADYEAGEFTPIYSTETTDTTFGYNGQYGYYVKIGKMVYYQLYIRMANSNFVSGGSGNLVIKGFPFASQSATTHPNVAFGGLNVAYTWGWSGSAVDRGLHSSGASKVYLYVGQSSGTNTNASNGNLASGTQLRAYGSYIAA